MNKRNPLILAAGVFLAGCTWVQLEPAAQEVMVLPQERVQHCRQIGTVKTQTTTRYWLIARQESSIVEELDRLARNEATDLPDGDTVSPISPVVDGSRRYAIYDCID